MDYNYPKKYFTLLMNKTALWWMVKPHVFQNTFTSVIATTRWEKQAAVSYSKRFFLFKVFFSLDLKKFIS